MEPLLILDAGHGGQEIGTGSNSKWTEKAINLQISHYQYKRFKELEIPVAMTRTTDETISKEERARMIRESGAKYCISNHINSGKEGGVNIIYSIYCEDKLSQAIADELRKEGQKINEVFSKSLPDNPKQDLHYMNRETENVQTTIIKYGFADSGQDVTKLNGSWKKYAEAVVRGFCRYEGFQYFNPKIEENKQDDFEPVEKKEEDLTGYVLHLPAHAPFWKVYPLGIEPKEGQELGVIHPKKFNGLEYKILGSAHPHVYTISTSSFGTVQICAHPETGAVVKDLEEELDK
ncbi:N-acetylmuramoyl-L-alanine amidase [Radiobacillus kanasensis]|uniref:N-acetylmuramoyl-L-alanine amidase family protein n=1 Tax=Radiobacillus kanasensis TaxID=2844358 RepID=UPI001E374997|nr:N-acetylmuramoyl-L-alanine amidase [Radiobacillus kanasensis]UFU00838.1 N-acetylmuramoyl-L-alanine amidase [Radiobacillus kanasensis]